MSQQSYRPSSSRSRRGSSASNTRDVVLARSSMFEGAREDMAAASRSRDIERNSRYTDQSAYPQQQRSGRSSSRSRAAEPSFAPNDNYRSVRSAAPANNPFRPREGAYNQGTAPVPYATGRTARRMRVSDKGEVTMERAAITRDVIPNSAGGEVRITRFGMERIEVIPPGARSSRRIEELPSSSTGGRGGSDSRAPGYERDPSTTMRFGSVRRSEAPSPSRRFQEVTRSSTGDRGRSEARGSAFERDASRMSRRESVRRSASVRPHESASRNDPGVGGEERMVSRRMSASRSFRPDNQSINSAMKRLGNSHSRRE